MAFSLNTIQAITQNYIAPKIVDNCFKGSPYTHWLRENGRVTLRGGLVLRFPIIKAEMNFDWYTGMDAATLEALEPFTAAEFNWFNGRVPYVIPEEDIDKNNGPDGIVDLVDAVEQTASLTATEELSDALLGTNTSNTKQVDGLQDLFAASGTSYGGLTDTDFTSPASWLSNILTPLAAGTLTAVEMRRMRAAATRGASKPNLGLCNFSVYGKIWSLAQGAQRFGVMDSAKLGFDNVTFEDMVIMPDEHASGSGYGTADNWLMMLNSDYLRLNVHENKAFISRVYAPVPQIEAYIGKLLFMIAHTTSQRRAHSCFKTINPSS